MSKKDINEFMIGDYIAYPTTTPEPIMGLVPDGGDGKSYQFFNGVEFFPLNDSELIPLTPKMMEYNGYVNYGDSWCLPTKGEDNPPHVIVMFHGNKIKVQIYCKDYSIGAFNRVWENHIYVHEFQNTLRVCGLTKLANEFLPYEKK